VLFRSNGGVGYVFITPNYTLISKIKLIDERLISYTLREIGLIDWTVKRVNYDDDIILFILNDEKISRAYNFSFGLSMYEKMEFIAGKHKDYEIPIQEGYYEIIWSLRNAPHAILSGDTGSGKSYFLLYLIMMISLKNGILFLADPKRSDLYSLNIFMPKNRVQYEPNKICEMISSVVEIMEKRYEIMETERQKRGTFQDDFADYKFPLIVLVIEEMASLVSNLDKKLRESFESDIKDITMLGRQAGVMLISVMQSPNTNNITSESRSQIGFRAFLGHSGGIEYRMLFGEGYTYSNRVYKQGQGLFMNKGKTIQPEKIETPLLDKKQLAETLKLALEKQFNDFY
jgi:hypothetical protein